jgi:cysteine sulfinate desulfinase/cysteine desulfurase-like protein
VLQAMGFDAAQAASGLRFSLGPWLVESQLGRVCMALEAAIASCSSEAPDP